jgi:putative transcriptional regulator
MKNKIREVRVAHQMTQEELAEKIGVSRQTINAIEKGKFDPSLPTAFKMARLFEQSIEALFHYEEET